MRTAEEDRAPRALLWTVGACALAVAALLLWETQVWHPCFAFGDEAAMAGVIARLYGGAPFHWTPLQGSVSWMISLLGLELTGPGPGRMALPCLAVFALELSLLWKVGCRWAGREAAAWAVLVDLVNANSWLRARTFLTFHALPAELLLMAWAAGKVRGPRGAALWGAALSLLLLDYEGALVALPFLALAVLANEAVLRAEWKAGLAGALLGLAAMGLGFHELWGTYVRDRTEASLIPEHPAAGGSLWVAWRANLEGLAAGGEPLSYMAISRWPAFPYWAWVGLGLGVAGSGAGAGSLALWAVLPVLVVTFSHAPAGLPVERLATAWPALFLCAGSGLARLRRAPRLGGALAALLLAAGLASETQAYFRHMAVMGSMTWGHGALVQEAARAVHRDVERSGAGIATAWVELRHPEIRLQLSPAPPVAAGAGLWVLLPPGSGAKPGPGVRLLEISGTANVEPVYLLRADGEAARRYGAADADLRRLLDGERRGDDAMGWLDAPGHDPLAWSEALAAELLLAGAHGRLDGAHWALVKRDPGLSPDLAVTEARLVQRSRPDLALVEARRALALDPDYGPAWEASVKALQAMGRLDEAQRARDAWARRWRAGTAAQVYE